MHTCQRAGPVVGLNGPGRAEVFTFVKGPQRALLYFCGHHKALQIRTSSYIDVNAFWITKELVMKNPLLGLKHFGSAINPILQEYQKSSSGPQRADI